ncbi:uncharacterized protein LOC112524321 [Cynara cardunculus var. scolymus]|uniref:uncharacterized protein LOC112524321 n=1 Tax=Cynara cardunculus var. scolymus TaxID=59895 RepID=UPI000D62BDD3|nr:uncharacterized protein LOC112524321 [Cynara cardunculus var. scolymus]
MGDPSTSSSTIARHRPPSLKRSEVPPWVFIMINIAYEECTIHSNAKDNNKFDRFCIDCLGSFCSKCSSNHHGHNYIKIRRYVYCEVISRPDFQKHFDCSGIQGYISNSNKVLFLKKRKPQQQRLAEQQNSRDHRCIVCKLSLTDSSYCSIQCKVSAMSPELATVDNNVSINEGERDPALITSKRKRLRKGIPQRAPLS